MPSTRITIAGRSRDTAERLASFLSAQAEFKVDVRVLSNGHVDPLHGVTLLPDILLLHCAGGDSELEFLAEHGPREQLPLIVCGRDGDTVTMRLAMRAGARDYLTESMPNQDLLNSIQRILEETARQRSTDLGQLIVVVNGKGGSGASMIATNLAHSLVGNGDRDVTLVDLDLQFGGLCRYLDISPEVSIMQALESATEMDEISAEAYTCRHDSGLKLMAAQSKQPVLPRGVSTERLDALLKVYLSINDFVVVDSPAHLDPATALFFEKADHIFVVVQQSLPHVQDAARLMQILASELAVSKDRMDVIVNRYSKKAEVEIGDIKKALRLNSIHTVPNHFKLATESINTGVPLADISRAAALTKSIRKLKDSLTESDDGSHPTMLERSLPSFLRR